MKKIGLFGTLVFNIFKMENEDFPIHFEEAIPGLVSKREERNHHGHGYVLVDLEMDEYITRLRVGANGVIRVSIGKKVEFPEEEYNV